MGNAMPEKNDNVNLNPFELNLELAQELKAAHVDFLDAGRGNPNWVATTPRESFFLLGLFANQELEGQADNLLVAPLANDQDRLERFKAFIAQHPGAGAYFLACCLELPETVLGLSAANWLDEMLDYIIGDNYPNPVRCLAAVEQPIKAYLQQELFNNQAPDFDLFNVEGGTAGIVYVFNTLLNNGLLKKGDRIALFLPTFAPYLEIPNLDKYQFEIVKINAHSVVRNVKVTHQFAPEELDKLRDTSIKVAFVVNPSNPTADAMEPAAVSQIEQIIREDHPNLMVVTDDVYGTFIPNFKSLFATIPYNAICIYSYSKYFGGTGWRVGNIAVAVENVFDDLLRKLPAQQQAINRKNYELMTADADRVPFIDRLVADSRDVALHHAAGISTPQQVMMALFSLYALVDEGKQYKEDVVNLCRQREKILYQSLGLKMPIPEFDTAYYCEINFTQWLAERYEAEFSEYFKANWDITRLLTFIAREEHLLLLKAKDFGSHDWAIRVSLANLATNQYQQVGEKITHAASAIHQQWLRNQVEVNN